MEETVADVSKKIVQTKMEHTAQNRRKYVNERSTKDYDCTMNKLSIPKRTSVKGSQKTTELIGKDNFLKTALLEELLCTSLRNVIQVELEKTYKSFEEFINLHQHDIYHMCYTMTKCCRCKSQSLNPHTIIINESHLDQLFDSNDRLSCHQNDLNINCCCRAKKGISTDTIDAYLVCALLLNICNRVFWYICLDLQSVSLEHLLNRNKHEIFHNLKSPVCCKPDCNLIFMNKGKEIKLQENDWDQLYKQNTSQCVFQHSMNDSGGPKCCCCSEATSCIQIGDLEFELQKIILDIVCPIKHEIKLVMDSLLELYAYSITGAIPCGEFKKIYGKLSKVIKRIDYAFSNESSFEKNIEKKFDETLYRKSLAVFWKKFSKIENLNPNRSGRLEMNISDVNHRKLANKDLNERPLKDKDVFKQGDDSGECHSLVETDHCRTCEEQDQQPYSLWCYEHSKPRTRYCKTHELPLCYDCLQMHNKCTVNFLEDVAEGVKTSVQFQNIEQSIHNVAKYINEVILGLKNELSLISEKREVFLKAIDDTREKLSSFLGDIEGEGLKNFVAYEIEMKDFLTEMSKLENIGKENEAEIATSRKYAIESESFLSLSSIEKRLQRDENKLRNTLQNKRVDIIEPVVKLETLSMQNFQILYDPGKRSFMELFPIPESFAANPYQRIKDAQFVENFEIQSVKDGIRITDCAILSNGELCLVDSKRNRLVFRNLDGSFKSFHLQPAPCGVTVISNSEVAVLHRSSVAMVNVHENVLVDFKFRTVGKFRHITFHRYNLIVCVGSDCFFVINLQGKKIREINIVEDLISCISCTDNKIFYANCDKNTICSVDLQSGESNFVMNIDKIVKSPTGIAADGSGFMFVFGSSKNNVVVLSAHDKHFNKELIRGIPNVNYPKAMSYNAANRLLLICSPIGQAVVYSLR